MLDERRVAVLTSKLEGLKWKLNDNEYNEHEDSEPQTILKVKMKIKLKIDW